MRGLAAAIAVAGIRGAVQAEQLDGIAFGGYCLEAAEVILDYEEKPAAVALVDSSPTCDCSECEG